MGTFGDWLANLRDKTVIRGTIQKVEEINGCEIWMRRFWDDPNGKDPLLTIKRIPAWMILGNGVRRGLINQHTTSIATASSGNFLYELGIAAREISKETGFDLNIIGFVPRRIPDTKLKVIRGLGIDVVKVETEQDLCPREATVMAERRFASTRRNIYNADQYISHENPLGHQIITARTIDEETSSLGLEPDKILVPTGTGGTMGGLSTYYHLKQGKHRDIPKICGVQPTVKHHILGVHHITIGEGCQWNPETYGALFENKIDTVDDVDAYAAMLRLKEKGIPAGPSTGLVYHQALVEARKGSNILITSADNDFKYYDWTREILSGQIGREISLRYPEMEETVASRLEDLSKKPNEDQILNRIVEIYGSWEIGRETTYGEFISSNYSFK